MDYKSIFEFSDIINYISKNFLCYVDSLSLSIAYPSIKKYVNKEYLDVNKIIFKRLHEIFKDKTQEFIDNLMIYKRYISGSFILQCIYSVYWENSDVDIYYIDDNINETLHPPFDEFIWNKTLNVNKYNLNYVGDYQSYEFIPVNSRHFKCNNIQVDYIGIIKESSVDVHANHSCHTYCPSINYDSIFHFVDDIYDIDICKIIYDGKRIYIRNLDNLFKKSSNAHLHLDKYIRTDLWPEASITQPQLIIKTIERIKKYKLRGFTIIETFNYPDEIKFAIIKLKNIKNCKIHHVCQQYGVDLKKLLEYLGLEEYMYLI